MTTPSISEITRRLEPVAHDPFVDRLTVPSASLVEAGRAADRVQERAGSDA
jgi:hypothetical protein